MNISPDALFLSLSQFTGRAVRRMDMNLGLHGISYSEYQVLHQLSQSAMLTLPRMELARSVGLSASGVTRMIAPMEKTGLVAKESHPRDARMSLVKLTDSGRTLYENASETLRQVATDFLGDLSKTQRDALSELFSEGG